MKIKLNLIFKFINILLLILITSCDKEKLIKTNENVIKVIGLDYRSIPLNSYSKENIEQKNNLIINTQEEESQEESQEEESQEESQEEESQEKENGIPPLVPEEDQECNDPTIC